MDTFKVISQEWDGTDGWPIANFGVESEDDRSYFVVTCGVRASQLHAVSGGAKADAELVCRLLNEHFEQEANDGRI